jgi:thiol:disulfide interchange protein
VFPVLSIKLLSFVGHGGAGDREVRAQGWAYSFGILASFWVLVGALLGLRLGGEQLGWGFQLQSPGFLIFLAGLLFIFGLNLAGVFELGSSFMGVGSKLASRGGLWGAFFTGVLATVVATPCTAPFMGTAIGFALAQPAWVAILIFTALAIGLALPYLLLSHFTGFVAILPRPGRWMETFKQFMAFPIFATVLWLVWVFGLQTGTSSMFRLLIGLLGLGLGAWAIGRWGGKRAALFAGIAIWILSMAFVYSGKRELQSEPVSNGPAMGIQWEKFSPEKVAEYRAQGKAVFVDFTAAWCVSCQVNELMVFRSQEVVKKFRELGVVMMKGDWTSHDPVITQTLESFGKSGVPVYVLYSGKKDSPADVLPEIITPTLVLERLNRL